MNSYEGMLIVNAALDKDGQEKVIEEIKGVVTRNKGEVDQVQNWGKRRLAFPIKKQAEGIYLLMDFKSDPLVLKKVESAYKLNDSIIRTLITKKEV